VPLLGQFWGGDLSAIFHGASDGRLVNCFILSTETILFSTLQVTVMVYDKRPLKDSPYDRDKPTYSAKPKLYPIGTIHC